MPYVTNGGVQIYYEVEGNGSPLVLVHGGAGSTDYWHSYGYVERLVNDYTVILYDARGHGKSDKPYTPEAYNSQHMVHDALAILDELKIDSAHFWGYSMGGKTAFVAASLYPERLRSVVIGASHPYNFDPSDLVNVWQLGIAKGAEAVVATMREKVTVSAQFEERLRMLDFRAQAACVQGCAQYWENPEEKLIAMNMPFCFYIGKQDVSYSLANKAADILPNAEFHSFPGLDHGGISSAVDLVVPTVKTFLARVI